MENKNGTKQGTLKRKSAFAHMFWINLLYANPMTSSNVTGRKKFQNRERAISPLILRNYMIGTVVILVLYGAMFYGTNFFAMPSFLDSLLGIITLMNLVNNFTLFFNVFYESNDADSYMSLPISSKTVFLSKLSVVGITSAQLSVMVIPLFTKFFYDMGSNLLVAILMGLVNFILFSAFTICLNIGLMLLMAKTSLLTKLRTKIIVILTVIAMAANIGLIILIQDYTRDSINQSYFGLVGVSDLPISSLLIEPYGELIFVGVAVAIIAITYLILTRIGIKGLYKNIRRIQQGRFDGQDEKAKLKEEKSKAKLMKSDGISVPTKIRPPFKIMLKHNMSLLKNGTLIAQLLVPILMPVIVVLPQIGNLQHPVVNFFLQQHGVSFMMIMGTIVAVIGNAGNSISAMLISLDGTMYEYIKSLPLSRKSYINMKYLTSVVIQSVLPSITLLVFGLFMEMNPIAIVAGVVTFLIFNGALALLWTIYDYNHVITHWQSVNQLITRAGRVLPVIITLLGIIALVMLILLYTLLDVEEIVLDGVIAALLSVVVILALFKFKKLKGKLTD
jgi:putative ATP synthase F0, A subunit